MKCFYINLDHASGRRERLEAEFRAMAPAHWTLQRIPAVSAVEAAASAGAIRPPQKGCYLSHLKALRAALAVDGDVMILEDDAQFSPRSFEIIDHLSAQAAPWDVLFTDLMILDTEKMTPFAARYPRLVGERAFLIEDLATTAFAGSSAYLVRRASMPRVLDVVGGAGLDLPYDLRLRRLFETGELSGRVCIPLVTTVSPEAEESQIADHGFAHSLKQAALQLFRRLMFFDRDVAALELDGARIAARADDAHSRLCGIALGGIIAQSADEMSDHLASIASVGRLEEAEAGLRALLAAQPDHPPARMNLAQVLLAQGRYPEAAPYYEARHAVRVGARPKPDFPYPEWAGEDLRGRRLLIFSEQGLGDEIMLARFAPHLARQGADVTLICAPALERLFAANLGVRVIAAQGEVSFPDPDYWIMASALVTAGGWTPETLPRAPYLQADPRRSGGLGVKTRGSPQHRNDANRSLPDDLARELLSLPGAVDLEPSATAASDFQDTAEIVAGLDLVITVDTSVAHLAGAMGRPVWILLPAVSVDWRWMRERTDSPWYPSARLFRQTEAEGWAGVVRDVRQALAQISPLQGDPS